MLCEKNLLSTDVNMSMVDQPRITLAVSMRLRHLHQKDGLTGQDLLKKYPQFPLRTIQRHMSKSLRDNTLDKRIFNAPPKPLKKTTAKAKRKYTAVPPEVSLHLRYLHQDLGLCQKRLCSRYPQYCASSIYKHMVKAIGKTCIDKRFQNTGRRAVLSPRDRRLILQQVPKIRRETEGDFTLHDIRQASNVPKNVSDSTVRRVLKKAGYAVRAKRRKGILTENDVKLRLKFAKHAKKNLPTEIWSETISFYLDGVGFVHKLNPSLNARRRNGKTWRKRAEGLDLHCTAAGSREGDGGRIVKFMVSIGYGRGVCMCEEYTDRLTGESFAQFIRTYFPQCFQESTNPKGKLFLQDGDPRQNSCMAMNALAEIGGHKFAIPPRSPDLNPIENLFHITKRTLTKEALEKRITYETYEEFVGRVEQTLKATPVSIIDNIIGSMNKRIDMVIQRKGQRIKY